MRLRALNERGLTEFTDWLRKGAHRSPPLRLIEETGTSRGLGSEVVVDEARQFENRYEFGQYLCECLKPLTAGGLENDVGVWSALGLVWFDQICPRGSGGRRRPTPEYLFVLSTDWRQEYRHMVRPCWQLVRDHGDRARLMLLAGSERLDSLRRRGEIFEQMASRSGVFFNAGVVSAVAGLYADPATGRPRRGAAGKGAGSIRRMGLLLTQLDLTFDLASVPEGRMEGLVPAEFGRWK